MDRGDRQEDIFVNDVDRQDFLKTLAEACQKTDWQVHAYCLMRNHFHMVSPCSIPASAPYQRSLPILLTPPTTTPCARGLSNAPLY
jgi:REP element-mobilizing transposase RayT